MIIHYSKYTLLHINLFQFFHTFIILTTVDSITIEKVLKTKGIK